MWTDISRYVVVALFLLCERDCYLRVGQVGRSLSILGYGELFVTSKALDCYSQVPCLANDLVQPTIQRHNAWLAFFIGALLYRGNLGGSGGSIDGYSTVTCISTFDFSSYWT